MPYVSIDIDLDEIDTEDLVEELCDRLKRDFGRKALTDDQKKDLKETFGPMMESLGLVPSSDILQIKTLEDRIKYEHLAKVFSKYQVSHIQQALPD